jgi:Ni/Fe-hydrogenase subunit HybB-like protein
VSAPVNVRLATTKAVLWLLVGVAAAVAAVRYALGLGLTTALSDQTPWGLWIGLDVMAGVALAAGGFVIAASVYVFHRERFHALVRPAVLTAFLGYVAVVLGLLIDLGRPWNIWRMTVYWQPTSALFEVGWCVMLYLSVLTLEFAPVVFEGLRWSRAFALLKRATLPLVILGIALSTLHQSSLGTLLVIAPGRLHPLWYSPILPLLFLVSAVALGLATVVAEDVTSSWLYRREPEWTILTSLTRASAFVLLLYFVLRLGDLAWRGTLGRVFEGTGWSALFVLELLVSVVVPVLIFLFPSTCRSPRALSVGAFLAVGGFVLNRALVGGIAQLARTGDSYVPALTEIAISLGVIAAMALVFMFFVEHLGVWETPPAAPDHFRPAVTDPASAVRLRGPWFGGVQRSALACLVGIVLGLGIASGEVARRREVRPTPVAPPRTVAVERPEGPEGTLHKLMLLPAATTGGKLENVLLLSAAGSGRYVLFEHERHQSRLGGVSSCRRCHHLNRRLDKATSCRACHCDMYAATDTFGHAAHVASLGGNASCQKCHRPEKAKTREGSTPCETCHAADGGPPAGLAARRTWVPGIAPGYRDSLHTLCISCHRSEEAKKGQKPYLSRCPACHRGAAVGDENLRVREGAVLVARR